MSANSSTDTRRHPGIKRSYLTVPAVVDEFSGYCKVEICIPNDADYRMLFYTAIDLLSKWYNYERTGNNDGAKVAAVWRKIRDSVDLLGSCKNCDCDCDCGCDGGCADFLSGCNDCGDCD